VSDILVRPAVPDDARLVEDLRLTSWRSAYRGLVADAYLDVLAVTIEGVERVRTRLAAGGSAELLAYVDGRPVGMAAAGPGRDEDLSGVVELYALYVLTDVFGKGVGQALLDAAGPTNALWVLEHNTRARAFYARNGFVPDGERKLFDAGGLVPEIRMVRDLG
jgi:GNAT superfamily N-acetyltransferase